MSAKDPTKKTFSGLYVIVVGDPVKGFDFIGPFGSYEDASNYRIHMDGASWCIAPLETP